MPKTKKRKASPTNTGNPSGTKVPKNLGLNSKSLPTFKQQRLGQLASTGLNADIAKDLQSLSSDWVLWATSNPKSNYSKRIRVGTTKQITNRNTKSTFVGIGLDESLPTRLLKDSSFWRNKKSKITKSQAEDIFNTRSRTSDLIWATEKPGPNPTPGTWEPISGHTPGVKKDNVGGTIKAITKEHYKRDKSRENAIEKTLKDPNSPDQWGDSFVMGSLATIKYMASPAAELNSVRSYIIDTNKMTSPRYTALTGNNDIRDPTTFDDMVSHVQEERERKKWEVGSVMMNKTRLAPLVPPTISNYLNVHGNEPRKAMDAFRNDQHKSLPAPSINISPSSDTEDFTQSSLNTMVQRRGRALSDARKLSPVTPTNSRGH